MLIINRPVTGCKDGMKSVHSPNLRLSHAPFGFTDLDNITLLNRISTPCFGEAKFWAKQGGDTDMDEFPAMQGFERLVEDSRAQQQRGVQLFSRKGLAASLCEPPDQDNFKVIQLT